MTKDTEFFPSAADWRHWLSKHHATARELWVGFYKKGSGKPSLTWPESVDQALCFGWIDGLRKIVDADSYKIRFTPRRVGSTWSNVNIKRVQALTELGLMQPAGLKAFEARDPQRSGIYTYEQAKQQFDSGYEKKLKANKKAWAFFQAQAPWYQRTAMRWVASAKREETRQKRLAQLIEDSAQGRTIPPLTRR